MVLFGGKSKSAKSDATQGKVNQPQDEHSVPHLWLLTEAGKKKDEQPLPQQKVETLKS